MSRLNDFITKLGRVIIYYAKSQKIALDTDAEVITAKTPDELVLFLQSIRDKLPYPTRNSFINYSIYIIEKIKPLSDRNTLLTLDEENHINAWLKPYLTAVFTLLDISKDTEVELQYDQLQTSAKRFISRVGIFDSSKKLSIMGEIVTNYLINNISATNMSDIESYLKKLVDEHQSILKVPYLDEQNKGYKKVNASLFKENTDLIKQLSDICDEKNKLTEENESLKKENDFLRKQNTDLVNQIKQLDQRIVDLEKTTKQLENNKPNLFSAYPPNIYSLFPRALSKPPETNSVLSAPNTLNSSPNNA